MREEKAEATDRFDVHRYRGTWSGTRALLRGSSLNLLPCFAQHHVYIHLFLSAIDGDAHSIARAVIVHNLAEVLLVLDLLAIDGDNQIPADRDWNISQICAFGAAVQAGAVCGTARYNLHDQ